MPRCIWLFAFRFRVLRLSREVGDSWNSLLVAFPVSQGLPGLDWRVETGGVTVGLDGRRKSGACGGLDGGVITCCWNVPLGGVVVRKGGGISGFFSSFGGIPEAPARLRSTLGRLGRRLVSRRPTPNPGLSGRLIFAMACLDPSDAANEVGER